MAVYQFECKACGKHFEVTVPISEHDRLKKRPVRHTFSSAPRRLLSPVPASSSRHSTSTWWTKSPSSWHPYCSAPASASSGSSPTL